MKYRQEGLLTLNYAWRLEQNPGRKLLASSRMLSPPLVSVCGGNREAFSLTTVSRELQGQLLWNLCFQNVSLLVSARDQQTSFYHQPVPISITLHHQPCSWYAFAWCVFPAKYMKLVLFSQRSTPTNLQLKNPDSKGAFSLLLFRLQVGRAPNYGKGYAPTDQKFRKPCHFKNLCKNLIHLEED